MGMTSANNLIRVLDNVEGALACELLGAVTATDFRRPLKSGAGTQAAYDVSRANDRTLDRRSSPGARYRICAPADRFGIAVAAAVQPRKRLNNVGRTRYNLIFTDK